MLEFFNPEQRLFVSTGGQTLDLDKEAAVSLDLINNRVTLNIVDPEDEVPF